MSIFIPHHAMMFLLSESFKDSYIVERHSPLIHPNRKLPKINFKKIKVHNLGVLFYSETMIKPPSWHAAPSPNTHTSMTLFLITFVGPNYSQCPLHKW